MARRLVLFLMGLGLVAGPGLVPIASASAASSVVLTAPSVSPAQGSAPEAARPDTTMHVTRVFSPNGDGVRDVAKVRYTLTRATSDVTLSVTRLHRDHSEIVRTIRVGDLSAGTHTWRWDGRNSRARPREGDYLIALGGA